MRDSEDNHYYDRAPSRLLWPLRQIGWFLERHILWRLSDSFRYRSPFAYIGITLALTVTAGAIGAAFYFHGEAQKGPAKPITPVTAGIPAQTADTVILPAAPTTPPVQERDDDTGNTLQGVVPNFKAPDRRAGSSGKGKSAAAATLVKPAKAPTSRPLKVAHRFASTFAGYEVGEKKAARALGRTSTAKLSKQLRRNPPRLPVNGKVPKATVMNVVQGPGKKGRLAVSVSLMRSGAASELRLGLTRSGGHGWRVSEVRG